MACMEHTCRRCNWVTMDNFHATCCPDHPNDTSHFYDDDDNLDGFDVDPDYDELSSFDDEDYYDERSSFDDEDYYDV